jgi:hypothetical protein
MYLKNCELCGQQWEATNKDLSVRRFCGVACRNRYISKGNVKNGYWVDKDGYAIKDINGKHYRLHRLVMEQKLGRKLLKEEQVHHINGTRLDNSIENLELFESRSKHLRERHKEASARNWEKALVSLGFRDAKMAS